MMKNKLNSERKLKKKKHSHSQSFLTKWKSVMLNFLLSLVLFSKNQKLNYVNHESLKWNLTEIPKAELSDFHALCVKSLKKKKKPKNAFLAQDGCKMCFKNKKQTKKPYVLGST